MKFGQAQSQAAESKGLQQLFSFFFIKLLPGKVRKFAINGSMPLYLRQLFAYRRLLFILHQHIFEPWP